MKKVRIMLAAIAVLGIVGGALAFKAKSPNPAYCYAPLTTTLCSGALTAGLTIDAGSDIHYTTTINRAACPGYTRCTLVGAAPKE